MLPDLITALFRLARQLGELYYSPAWQEEISGLPRVARQNMASILRTIARICLLAAVDLEADLRNYGLQAPPDDS